MLQKYVVIWICHNSDSEIS